MDTLNFLTSELAGRIAAKYGTPVYVYDEGMLRSQAAALLRFPHAYGLTARFAVKACPNGSILKTFDDCGLHFDVSSRHECDRAVRAGILAPKLSLSSQEFPEDFLNLHELGIAFNACSLHQLERFGQLLPGQRLGVRFNPGLGSGGSNRTNTGGPASSFGIWHEKADAVADLVARYNLKLIRIHTHIGSGGDPEVWKRVAGMSLDLVRRFGSVGTLNLGGGFKVGRMAGESAADLAEIGRSVREAFMALHDETGRKIRLEVEPGTWLVANAGSLITTVHDIASTGPDGFDFIKLDSGMTEILRPSHYGAQHPLVLVPAEERGATRRYVVVGHCCESGDLLTPAPGQPEQLATRELPVAAIGDLCVIEGVGAYCASMSAKNYNSFPDAPEVLLCENGDLRLIRKRQTLDQVVENEVAPRVESG